MKKKKIKTIEEMISEIEKTRDKYLVVAEDIGKAYNYSILTSDFFIYGGIERAVDITDSFLLLLKQDHFQSAGALLRMHLDTLLRLYALTLVKSKQEFVLAVMEGKHINKLKDINGNNLTDKYLRESFFSAPENKPWIQLDKVYTETSGFIHFSDKHIYAPFKKAEGNKMILNLGAKLEVPEESKKEILGAFLMISDAHLTYLYGWRDLKKSYENKK